MKAALLALPALFLVLAGCVPNKAFQAKTPTVDYRYPDDDYYQPASAGLAFIEFLQNGALADDKERDAAFQKIEEYNRLNPSKGAIVFVFVHGWKNNASEQSGNVSGFRRALDFMARRTVRPVLGIYIGWPGVGWPGQNTGFAENVSFSNRESVAYAVGAKPLRETLVGILRHAKGPEFDGNSSVILMGHSFGGLVLESAITPVLKSRLDQIGTRGKIRSPADLILLINEAASAELARPLLYYLHDQHVKYRDDHGRDVPLLVSITSKGDTVTKFAFPAGQWISPSRPKDLKKIDPPDAFGIDNERTYYLLTTANTVALQNHEFKRRPSNGLSDPPQAAYLTSRVSRKLVFDFVPIADPKPRNDTPYWVAQLPQVFVPDHGTVFGYEFIGLINEFVIKSQVIESGSNKVRRRLLLEKGD